MTTATRTRKPLDRHVSIGAPVHGLLAVKLTVGKDSFGYYLEKIPSAWGVAFRFGKFATEQVEGEPADYVVLIDTDGQRHQCECKGFCRFGMTAGRNRDAGHQGCKHIACVVELIRQGKTDARPIRTAGNPEPIPQPEAEPESNLDPFGHEIDALGETEESRQSRDEHYALHHSGIAPWM